MTPESDITPDMCNKNKPHELSRRRLLVLTSTFPRYKDDHEPSFVYELCRRFARSQDVTVLAPHASNALSQEVIDGVNVRRFRYAPSRLETLAYRGGIVANLKQNPFRFILVPFFIVSQFFALCKIVRQDSIDVIHAHWLIPQGVVALLCRIITNKSFQIVCTSHGGDLYGLQGGFARWLKRKVIHNADAITVVSEAMHVEAMKIAGTELKHIQVISMGVDASTIFTPGNVKRNENELLFVGRLVEKKGVDFLLAAMPLILKKYPNTILTIVGNGPEKVHLVQQVQQIGIDNQVRFLGALVQSELPDLYRRATIFVAPSVVAKSGDQEGLGLVFAEALACECAVISSDLAAIADVIIDGQTGITTKQKDSTDLANKIISLIGNKELRQTIGHNGRKHVLARFDWEIIANRYEQLLDDLSPRQETMKRNFT